MFRKFTITTKMLITTAIVGVVVWAVSDKYQNDHLTRIFNAKLSERLSHQSEAQRIRFDTYVKGHHKAVRLLANTSQLNAYVTSAQWKNRLEPLVHRTPPAWLPKVSIVRSFVQPRHMLLLSPDGTAQEYYCIDESPPPGELINPGSFLLSLSRNQGFLTRINNEPFLVTSEPVQSSEGKTDAILMLASPLDEQFLVASQGALLGRSNVIALLTEGEKTIQASSNSSLIPPGTTLESLEGEYIKIGQGFFDYGATDLVIVLVSFVSTEEAGALTNEVLREERTLRALTALAFILSFVAIGAFIARRIQRLTNKVVDFSIDMHHEQPKIDEGDQLWILEDRFERLAEAIQSETAALERQALHDPLTELPNRKLLHNRLQHEILRGERTGRQLSLIISDLNHFKEINDTLGHHIGDLVLRQAAERLYGIFRKSDTVARLGGDEFGILLPDTNAEQAARIAKKVVESFNKPFIAEGHKLTVGISIGITEYPSHGDDVNILMQRADVAMYLAKRNNLGFAIYDPMKDMHSVGRLALMSDLRHAIENKYLEIHYQPVAEMATGKVVSAESLLRWNHKTRGYIPPDEFIPLAEQTGLLNPLTFWVLEKTFQQCAIWRQTGLDIGMSVNISMQSLHDAKLPVMIKSLIDNNSVKPTCLTLEITESAIMTDPLRTRDILKSLSALGASLSIDDFGTGYSSLSYLKQLPVKVMKIDRSFVMEMVNNENDNVIVKATIDMAHSLGLKVVAEGVNSKQCWNMLREMECDYAQGYYIRKAMTSDEFIAWNKSGVWPSSELSQVI
jgi:diguanylate cyclase (GGDEF)-like protein